MKTEERHQLHTNDLEALANRAKPFLEQYGTQLIAGACGILLLVGGVAWWNSSSSAENAAGWNAISEHMTEDYVAGGATAEEYAAVADRYPGEAVAAWARTREAEKHLNSGLRLAFTDRESAISDLKQARRAWQETLKNPQAATSVRETASYGLAVTLESMAGMKLDEGETVTPEEAAVAFEKFLGEFPNSVYQEVAKRRIEALRSGGGKEFYAWFSSQNPKPTDMPQPGDMGGPMSPGGGLPMDHPDIDSMPLPEIPDDLKLPGSSTPAETPAGPSLSIPGDNPAAPFPPAKPADEKPDSEKPDGATPEDKTPAEAPKPSADSPEKPEAEKPETEKPADAEEKPAAPAE